MRIVGLVTAVVALFVSGAALAQDWGEYVNREDFLQINLPDDPTIASSPYKTVKGTDLTAHVYTAKAPADSLLAGTYSVTVVDYTNAKAEIPDAIEQARQAVLTKGTMKYDEINNIDMHRARLMTVESATSRYLASILVAANNRLYITLAETPLSSAVPAQFQASIQILDANGVRIRTVTAPGAPEYEVAPIGAAANKAEQEKVVAAISGTWRMPNGTCEAAYFKSGERTQTVRKEEALAGTVTNMGVTVPGQLILSGAREGQFVDPATDKPFFLFQSKANNSKLNFFPIDGPARGWPEVDLDRCTG